MDKGIIRMMRLWMVLLAAVLGMASTMAQVHRQYRLPQHFDRKYMAADIVVVKLRVDRQVGNARVEDTGQSPLEKVMDVAKAVDVERPFARARQTSGRVGDRQHLSNIYKLRISDEGDVVQTINKLLLLPEVEYAEPYFLNELLYVPNDPQADPGAGQDNLPVIRAHDAWNTTVGDSNIVVGIVDTGVKLSHEDLDNAAVNIYDPVNGIDDDADGYIDNYYGWDLADNDNNPDADGPGHGTKVAGISSARTNNGIAMAGVGFRSKYLPIKVAETGSGLLVNSYEGIVYAADHGCKVINLSWGGVYPYFQYGQDVINYAVQERDAVVVAAAGNTSGDLDFYPASFDHVVSVGATDMGDNRASWATYSYHIDLMAPGQAVYTTDNNGGYSRGWGTSYSAPQVSGAAALVRARFPTLDAPQVMEQLRITSDDIYQVGNNMDYYGQLGKGRLNVQRAVAGINSPSIRQISYTYATGFDQYIFSGDTLIIDGQFKNHLGPAQKVTVTLSSPTENVFLDSDAYYLGNMGMGDEGNNNDEPFVVRLGDAVKPGERIVFRLDYEGESYSDFQYFTMTTTPDYFPLVNEDALLTIASDGDLGFNRDSLKEGYGIAYNEKTVAYWSGLILAKDSTQVSDNVVNNFALYTRDQDFESIKYARLFKNSQADIDGRSVFGEHDMLANKTGVRVEQKILSWDLDADAEFFVLEYRVSNVTDSALHGLSLGLFTDWELNGEGNDAAAWDSALRLGYSYDKTYDNLYTGMALLSQQSPAHYSIDLLDKNGNTAELDSTFSDSSKYRFLSNGVQKEYAGVEGAGNDVAQITGYNGVNLDKGASRKLVFVMLFGNSLQHLKDNLALADSLYNVYLSRPPVGDIYYTCYGDSAIIDPSVGESFELYEDPYMETRLDSGAIFKTAPVYIDKDYYLVAVDDGLRSDITTAPVRIQNPTAGFGMEADTVLLSAGLDTEISFTDESVQADAWFWDFGNGYSSTIQAPSTFYNTPGLYEVQQIVRNQYGCVDSVVTELLVAEYGESPVLDGRSVCKGDTVHLRASNTSVIRVYADEEAEETLYEGPGFESDPLGRDTVFYVSNVEGPFESLPVAVGIDVRAPEPGFNYQLDTLNLDVKYALQLETMHPADNQVQWYLDGTAAGSEHIVSVDYSGKQDFTVRQVLESPDGCTDSITQLIHATESGVPVAESMVLCRGGTAVVQPGNGQIFYFYEDPSLVQPVYKGSQWPVGPLERSTTMYITAMDGLMESEPITVDIALSDLEAVVEATPDTLNLQYSNQAILSNNSSGASWSYWQFESGVIDPSPVLYETFTNTGVFSYELVVGDAHQCVDTVHKSIVVLNVTSLEDLASRALSVYPNPASGVVHFEVPGLAGTDARIQVTTMLGTSVYRGKVQKANTATLILDVSSYSKGVYLFEISAEDLVYFGRFVKQ